MGSSCTSLMQPPARYQRTRARSRAHTANLDGDEGFPQPINVHNKYTFGEGVIEEGATGRVVKGFETNNKHHQVAIKIMPKSSHHGNKTPQLLFENEVSLLAHLKHKNIVQLLDSGEDEHNYYVVLSLAKGGDFVEYLFDDSVDTTEHQAALWIRTLLETLRYLHSKNIAHCDLKPENIVFKSHRGCDDILLIDFGLAKSVHDESIYNDLCANRFYTAPEIAQHYLNLENRDSENIQMKSTLKLTGKIWKSTDIWAVGIISYIMVLKTLPFFARTDKEIFESIVNDTLKLPKINSERFAISKDFRDFIKNILHKHPHKRLTINQALKHPWIRCNSSSFDHVLNVNMMQEQMTFVRRSASRSSPSGSTEFGSLESSENYNNDNDNNVLTKAEVERPLKYLIYGYIRNVFVYDDDICTTHKVGHKRKLTVLDGNLYFNCRLKSHLSTRQNVESLMKTNQIMDDIPPLIINTIYDIVINFKAKQIVSDERTQTIA